MKKKYKDDKIFIITTVSITIFIIIFMYIINFKYNEYKLLTGIAVDRDKLKFILDSKNIKTLQKNSYLYLDNKKIKYNILSTNRNVVKKDDINYHEVIIKINTFNYEEYLNVSIFIGNKRIINLFKNIWKEKNGKTR